jgi:hypothetical protein
MSYDRPEWRVIVPEKETVVRRRGADWSFTLPEFHRIEVDQANKTVHLRTPLEGTTYELAGLEESEDQVIVRLGTELGSHGPPSVGPSGPEPRGYPLPEIQDEFARLTARWERAGFAPHEVHVYPEGATHEDQLRMIRRRLREA